MTIPRRDFLGTLALAPAALAACAAPGALAGGAGAPGPARAPEAPAGGSAALAAVRAFPLGPDAEPALVFHAAVRRGGR